MNGHWLFCFLSVFLLCFNLDVLHAAEDKIEELDEDEITIKRWRETFGRMKKWIGEGIKFAMPYFMEGMADENLHVSQQCRKALFQWISDIKTMKPWALKMADASAKLIDGVFSGSFSSFGSFDQCLEIVNPKKALQGKYCTLQFWPHLPPKPRFYALNQRLKAFRRFENDTSGHTKDSDTVLCLKNCLLAIIAGSAISFIVCMFQFNLIFAYNKVMGEFTKHLQLFYMFPLRWGVCIPSPCSESDLANITAQVSKRFMEINITVPPCEVKEPVKIETYQIPILCVITILLILVTFATAYDILIFGKNNSIKSSKDTDVISDVIKSFSACRNWNKLMDLEAGAESLSVLHGIRFFSMCWIILGHTYFHLNFSILRRLQITVELTSEFIFNAVTNANLVVDTFFFISGLLYLYVAIDMTKAMGKVPNAFYFIIHRFWRFWPIQMFFVGCSTLLPLLSSGPTWHENIDPIVDGCKKDWWANMIFINNLYRSTERGCLSYSWYLAADYQIYIFCIPIVALIIRKPRLGLWINFIVMTLSVIAVAVHNYIRDLPPAMLFTRADVEQRNELMRETYYTPYQHIGSFCIGIFVGYYLQARKKPLKLHWSLRLIAWSGTFAMTSAALFGVHPWNQGMSGTGKIPSMLYASLSRMAWTLGIAWVTVACSRGCGGILAPILRYKVFVPFSRLTFLVYMVHPLVQYVFYATLRDGIQAKNYLAFFICLAFIVVSYGIALVLALLLESPFISLGFVIYNRKEGPGKRNHNSCKDLSPVKPNSQSEPAPRLVNGYGKCNGAYEPQSEISKNSSFECSLPKGDFICHL